MLLSRKKILIGLIVITTAVSTLFFINFLNKNKVDFYLGFGDAIARGRLSDGTTRESYVDYTSDELKSQKSINNYSKAFTRIGLTSSDLLKIVANDYVSYENDGSAVKLKDRWRDLKYVTISIGTSDIMSKIKYDYNKGELTYDLEVLERAMSVIQQDIYDTVNEIDDKAPQAKVFVIGTYYPFVWLNDEEIKEHSSVFDLFNEVIKDGAVDSGAEFVDISDLSDKKYVSNHLDIHLNAEGQRLVSNKVLRSILS